MNNQRLYSVICLCLLLGLILSGCGGSANDDAGPVNSGSEIESGTQEPEELFQTGDTEEIAKKADSVTTEQNDIGALTPEDALDYMKAADGLVIVDVAATRWYDEQHFEGAISIPIEELDSDERDALYMEIPAGQPVLLHCRRGVIVPGAYRRVKELRPDIPEIVYIDGVPPFDDYSIWLAGQ